MSPIPYWSLEETIGAAGRGLAKLASLSLFSVLSNSLLSLFYLVMSCLFSKS
jgi:hypothetical protein